MSKNQTSAETLRLTAIEAVHDAGYTGWVTDPGFLRPTVAAMKMYATWLRGDEGRDDSGKVRAAREAVEALGAHLAGGDHG